jgi:hypothetical protein
VAQPEQPAARLKIRVQPRASSNLVEGYRGDTVRLRVTAPPEGGKANEAAVSALAQALGVAKGRIKIVRGHSSRDKLVLVEGLTIVEVEQRLKCRIG